jgi:hypothetical protein
MSDPRRDRSTRLARWWVRRYTAGLDEPAATFRRAEIDSDLAEHDRYRNGLGWPPARIGRERMRRLAAGAPSDIGWRHDRLRGRARRGVGLVVVPLTSIASLMLAAYYAAFAAYNLGNRALADHQILGRSPLQGFEAYADEAGASTAALIIAGLGFILALAAIARPIAPVVANAVTLPIATLAVMFFWLGVWPLGLAVIAGAATDLALRAPRVTPP